jgi:hypothetical protein
MTMNRPLAFLGALVLAFVTVSSACMAQPTDWIQFRLEPEHGNPAKIHASFRKESNGQDHDDWSTGFMPSDLIGMEVSSFHGSGTTPIHFAIIREAGRLDCSGTGGNDHATGNCRFADNPAFTELLVSRGIGRPSREQAFGLMAVNVQRALIDSLAAARYPTPGVNDLMALSALGADGTYITGMARAGYRPNSIHSLIEFKALGITPQWISGFARIGYANVPGEGLVQMKALGITPEFIEGFQRIGYRNLSVDRLVQLKALDITPEFVRETVGRQPEMPPVSELVQLKMFRTKR